MIGVLAAAVIAQSPAVVEWFEPTAQVVSIQAVVGLPELSPRRQAIVRLIAGCLGKETATYSKSQIQTVAGRTGAGLTVEVMGDHIRIGMETVPADAETGLAMLGSVLQESDVTSAEMQDVANDLQFRKFNFWRSGLDLTPFHPPKYSLQDIAELKSIVFRPDNVRIGVGGKVVPGAATAKWESIASVWKVPRLPVLPPDRVEHPTTPGEASVSLIDFQGPRISARDASFSTRLLALSTLGVGKSASLWRVSREKLKLSYRQEAILYPVVGGFLPRLLIAHSSREDLPAKSEALRKELLADIETWTSDDLRRGIGACESFLVRGGPFNPLYFSPGGPIDDSLADQTFMQAYWPTKASSRWNPHQIVGRLGFIELPELKEAAKKFISDSKIRLIEAR